MLELLRRQHSTVLAPRISWNPAIAVNLSISHGDTFIARGPAGRTEMTLPSPWRPTPRADAAGRARPSESHERGAAPGRVSPMEAVLRRTRQVIDVQRPPTLVTRVVARTERTEPHRFGGRDLVLATPAAATSRTQSVGAPELSPMSVSVRTQPASPRNGREVAQPINVERVADQVLQQLDRRVTAWRERMGRS